MSGVSADAILQVNRATNGGEIVQPSLKEPLVGENGERGRTAAGISARDRDGVEVGANHSLRR